MIHAAIYGKLDCLGSEDALTAAGPALYIPEFDDRGGLVTG